MAKEHLSEFKNKLETLSRAEKAEIENFHADKSLDRLETMLREDKARVNALSGASDSSRRKYESLQAEVSNCVLFRAILMLSDIQGRGSRKTLQ